MTKHMSGRKFGVELEIVGLALDEAKILLNRHKFYDWSVKFDSSISDRVFGEPGCEVISPPLKGRSGLAQVRKVVEILRKSGARANTSCGFHVHVDASDISVAWAQRLMARYMHHENAISNFMPSSRRNSGFARPMSELGQHHATLTRNVESFQNMAQFCLVPGSRYYRVNFCSFLRHGTLEFRQHSGTVSAEAVENWILFVLNFVESSKPLVGRRPASEGQRGRPAGKRAATAARLLRELQLSSCTAIQLANRCRVALASVPAIFSWLRREHGIHVVNFAFHGTRRYQIVYGEANEARARAFMNLHLQTACSSGSVRPSTSSNSLVAPAFLADYSQDDMYKGLDRAVIAYFRERTSEMAAE